MQQADLTAGGSSAGVESSARGGALLVSSIRAGREEEEAEAWRIRLAARRRVKSGEMDDWLPFGKAKAARQRETDGGSK